LTEKGIEFESIDYMKNSSLSETELKRLLRSAGLKPQDALRKNEPAYQQHVANKNLGDDDLIRVMAKHPELIQRPIVARGSKAVLARPAENLAELGIN
jgi:arsenate reductase (glutaredoxin)